MLLLIAIIGIGVMAFGIGRAALLRSDAQTAADAAALAGARNIKVQLERQLALKGYSSLAEVDRSQVEAAAADYARRNGARLSRPVQVEGADVRVWTDTLKDVGRLGAQTDREDQRGEARARGRLAIAAGSGVAGADAGGSAALPPNCDEKDLKISADGGARGIVEDAVRVAQCAGGANVYVGSDYRPGDTVGSGGLSDHAGNNSIRAARDIGVRGIDLLKGPPSPQLDRGAAAIGKIFGRSYGNGARLIIDSFQWKGYRIQIIWRTPKYGGHLGHIHIGALKGGASGLGLGGSSGIDAAQLLIKLVDWDAPAAADFTLGLPGGGGANPFGPPDPAVAAKLCNTLEATKAPPKARLALWMAAIVESGVHDLPDGHSSSVGVLQLLDIHLGGSVSARRDVELVATLFLKRGFTGRGGAIALSRNEGLTAGQVAQAVQGSAYPYRYDERREQAIALNERFCGGKGL